MDLQAQVKHLLWKGFNIPRNIKIRELYRAECNKYLSLSRISETKTEHLWLELTFYKFTTNEFLICWRIKKLIFKLDKIN